MNVSNKVESSEMNVTKVFWSVFVLLTLFLGIPLAKSLYDYRVKVDELKSAGSRSPVHQIVVEKYLLCREEFLSPSRDECVARVMTISRVQGVEYENQVASAIRDLSLDK